MKYGNVCTTLGTVPVLVESYFCGQPIRRMTLSDRLRSDMPTVKPALGRPQELPIVVEEALVQCLEICAEFNYPMRKKNLQDLVQSYCVENGIKTRCVT